MINRISGQQSVQRNIQSASQKNQSSNTSFDLALRQAMDSQAAASAQPVEFSKHAITRAEQRGIEITPDLIDQIKGSMIRAQAKGATNILAMDTEKAFIINVPNAKVITAITQDEMKDSVFTNIDGAVFL